MQHIQVGDQILKGVWVLYTHTRKLLAVNLSLCGRTIGIYSCEIVIVIALLNSSKRLFSLIYNVKYLKLNFPKIPLNNDVLFLL